MRTSIHLFDLTLLSSKNLNLFDFSRNQIHSISKNPKILQKNWNEWYIENRK